MAATAKLDTIENAVLQINGLQQSIQRGAFFTGLDPTLGAASIMAQCVGATNMPVLAPGTTAAASYPGYPGLIFQSLYITAVSGTCAKGYLLYSTPTGFPATVFLIEDTSQLMSYQSNKYLGTHYPIRIATYLDPGINSSTGLPNPPVQPQQSSYLPGVASVAADSATMTFRLRVRQIRVTRLLYGELYQYGGGTGGAAGYPPNGPSIQVVSSPLGGLTTSTGDAQGQVNIAPWYGKQPGHWLCDEFSTKASPYQGTILVVASAISRSNPNMPNFDWSETAILFNNITNKYVNVQNTAAQSGGNGQSIDEVMALPYQFGQIGPNTGGFVRAGPYTMTDFTSVFGF